MTATIDRLRDYFGVHAARYAMDPRTLVIEPVLNHGGFGNASFRIDDGRSRFHLKLTRDPADLAVFWTHAEYLTQYYRAPRARGWVDIPPLGSGILFESLAASPAGDGSMSLAKEVARLLETLHGDRDLAGRLSSDGQTCADTYHSTFGDRFSADLGMLARMRPPFVSNATVSFLASEARALDDIVDRHPGFADVATWPIHSDIWANNILVETGGHDALARWWLIDWDDLAIGDAALDIAMLLEFASGTDGLSVEPGALGIDLADAMSARTVVYRRASRLDWVIDSLADWLEAGNHPVWTDQVRAQKEADHRHALKRYRATYPQPPHAALEDRGSG